MSTCSATVVSTYSGDPWRRKDQRSVVVVNVSPLNSTTSQRPALTRRSRAHQQYNKLNVTVHRCLQEKAPRYLVDCCMPVSEVAGRDYSAQPCRHHLTVPRYRLSTFGRLRAFSVAGPTSCNSSQIVSVTQHWVLIVLGINLKRNSLSAEEMLHDSALYTFTIDIDIDNRKEKEKKPLLCKKNSKK